MSKPLYLEKYPHLFQPLTVGKKNIVYKNRIMVGPTQASGAYSSDTHGVINDYGVDYYTDFARGGFASCAIPIEVPAHSAHIGTLNLDEASKGFTFMHFAQRSIHAFGCRTACEIYHPGICALPEVCPPMGPSAFMYNGRMVHEMTEEDMEAVAQMYVMAARQARRCLFDAIMLHYGHGWLMNNFLSPLSNKRADCYGGSVENRVRFPLMVIKRIREVVGDDMIIEIRMNGSDRAEGGITPDDAARQALLMEEYVDMIHLSCGTRLDAHARPKMHPTCFVTPGHNIDGAEALKKAGFKKPVGVIGSVHSAEMAERFIAEGRCDYVLMARQAVADPDWVNKVRENREEDIRPCIHCDYCVDGGRRNPLTTEVTILNDATFETKCSVNPLVGQGSAWARAFRFTGKKSVAVDGEIKVPPGIGEAPAGEINGSMDHSCAGALRQPGVVNAVHIPVHQLAERSPLRTIALGVDIGNILGLNVHAQLLLLRAHGGVVKRHIHPLRTFLSYLRACAPLTLTIDPIPSYL